MFWYQFWTVIFEISSNWKFLQPVASLFNLVSCFYKHTCIHTSTIMNLRMHKLYIDIKNIEKLCLKTALWPIIFSYIYQLAAIIIYYVTSLFEVDEERHLFYLVDKSWSFNTVQQQIPRRLEQYFATVKQMQIKIDRKNVKRSWYKEPNTIWKCTC